MQAGETDKPRQTGGVDPGLAALIMSLIATGVGGVGYVYDPEKPEEKAKKALEEKYKDQIAAAEAKHTQATKDLAEAKAKEAALQDLTTQLNAERAKVATLEAEGKQKSDYDAIFRNADPATLRDAVKPTLEQLGIKPTETSAVFKALMYPSSPQGRLARMSLYDLYSKQFVPAFNKDFQKGGRMRRRGRGRNDLRAGAVVPPPPSMEDELNALDSLPSSPSGVSPASYATPPQADGVVPPPQPTATGVPSYDTFAKVYTDAIKTSTMTAKARSDTGVSNKKNETARKFIQTLADNLGTAVKNAKEEIAKNVELTAKLQASEVASSKKFLELQTKLQAGVDRVETDYLTSYKEPEKKKGWFSRGGGYDLAVMSKSGTTEDWENIKKEEDGAQKLLTDLKSGLKEYVAAAKAAAKEVPKDAPKKKGEKPNTPIHDGIMKKTPETIKKTEKNAKIIDTRIKEIENALKIIPKPEIFAGGCFVATTASQTLDILGGAYSRLAADLSELKTAFQKYKTQTDGIPYVLDTSFEYTRAEMLEKNAEEAAEKAKRAAEAAKLEAALPKRLDAARLKIEAIKKETRKKKLIEAYDEMRAKGIPPPPPVTYEMVFGPLPPPPPPPLVAEDGSLVGGGIKILRDLKAEIETAVEHVREDTLPLAGLVADSETLLNAIKAVPKQETLSPEEQQREATFCKKIEEEEEAETDDIVMTVNPMLQSLGDVKTPGQAPPPPASSSSTSQPGSTPPTPVASTPASTPALEGMSGEESPLPASLSAPPAIKTATGKDGVKLNLEDTVTCDLHGRDVTGVIERFEDKYDQGSKRMVRYVISKKTDTNGVTTQWSEPAKYCSLVASALPDEDGAASALRVGGPLPGNPAAKRGTVPGLAAAASANKAIPDAKAYKSPMSPNSRPSTKRRTNINLDGGKSRKRTLKKRRGGK
jgi:hypothetical protein